MTKVGVFLAKIVAIVNQKGGVGKTTTCVNLTSSLKEKGNRVLLCDFDPQANSTSGMGVDKAASRGVYDVLINGADVTASVAHTRYGDVLPSSKALAGAGIEMIDRENREFLLKQALDILSPNYDFILIDCPPSLELLTVNALCAANSLIVPVQGEYFALEGLSDLMHTVRMVRRSLNPGLELEGRAGSRCSTGARISPFKLRKRSSATSPARCIRPSSPAMCAFPRHRATASRSTTTTAPPAARRLTATSPTSF